MKKFAIIISIILALFCIRYCTCNACYGIHLTSSKFTKHKCEQIMKYICSEDIESLKEMFCTETSYSIDLDKELKEMINFFDGKVSTNFSIAGSICDERIRSGKITYSNIEITIDNVSTESRNYKIYITYYAANEEKDKIGIEGITIFDITQTDDISKLSEDDIFEVGDDI